MRKNRTNIITIIAAVAVLAALFIPAAPAGASGLKTAYAAETAYALGQLPPPDRDMEFDEFGNPIERQQPDSTKPRIRKPLESYFFNDSIRLLKIFSWNVSLMRNQITLIPIDTMISSFQVSYPFMGERVGHARQGNMGGASIPLDFAERPVYTNFAFAQAFDAYHIFPETARFFNTKLPFTQFSYFSSGNTNNYEEGFYLTHAQNISPSTGFNLDYKSQGTRGFYAWSRARAKNLSLAFSHTGKKYALHAGYIHNKIDNMENGGVVSDLSITAQREEYPANVPFKLSDARNKIRGNTFYLVQSYGFPLGRLAADDFSIADMSSVFVGHSVTYSRWNKVYTGTRAGNIFRDPAPTEDDPDAYVLREFYDNWYLNPLQTRDSISESLFSNRAFIQIQPFDRDGIVGLIDAGVGADVRGYYFLSPKDYITGSLKPERQTDIYVYGGVKGKFRRYLDWGADLRYHPVGANSGDMELGANAAISAFVRNRPITLSGSLRTETRSPDYWTENLISNHFAWSNSFSKETETRLNVTLSIPSLAFEAGVDQSVVTNRIYFDARALPAQYGSAVSVTGLFIGKVFRLGGFHLEHRVLLQWSTQENVIPVPMASAYLSYFYEFDVVKGALRARIGIDGRYNTKYYAFGYMPATAQFFNQNEKEVGGYPLLDAFVAAKWKRMRILLKFEHVNENMFGERNYFTLLHYPLKKRIFKLGFSWAFYD